MARNLPSGLSIVEGPMRATVVRRYLGELMTSLLMNFGEGRSSLKNSCTPYSGPCPRAENSAFAVFRPWFLDVSVLSCNTDPSGNVYFNRLADKAKFAEATSQLKNSLYARFDPRMGPKHTVFGAIWTFAFYALTRTLPNPALGVVVDYLARRAQQTQEQPDLCSCCPISWLSANASRVLPRFVVKGREPPRSARCNLRSQDFFPPPDQQRYICLVELPIHLRLGEVLRVLSHAPQHLSDGPRVRRTPAPSQHPQRSARALSRQPLRYQIHRKDRRPDPPPR